MASEGLRFDLDRLARICAGLIVLTVAAEAIYAWDAYSLRAYLDGIDAGTLTGLELDAEAERVDRQGTIIGLGSAAVSLITAVFCGVWIYRASWNARQLQPSEQRITPGWAVGWFFVPVMSLWKPWQAMRQCWNSSHNPGGPLDAPMPGFAVLWWGLWVVTSLVSNGSFRLSMKAEYTDDFRMVSTIDLALAPLNIACALLFLRLINAITAAQREKTPGLASVFA